MRNRILAVTRNSIPYVKGIMPIGRTVLGCILMQQLDYWFERYPNGFYKFQSPADHHLYRRGSSWEEELGVTVVEFRTAFDRIGTRYASKTAFLAEEDPFQGRFYASYFDRVTRVTMYYRNDELLDAALDRIMAVEVARGSGAYEEPWQSPDVRPVKLKQRSAKIARRPRKRKASPTESSSLVNTETESPAPTESASLVNTKSELPAPTESASLVNTETELPAPAESASLVNTKSELPAPAESASLVNTETELLAPTESASLVNTETELPAATESASLVNTVFVPGETRKHNLLYISTEITKDYYYQRAQEAPVDNSTPVGGSSSEIQRIEPPHQPPTMRAPVRTTEGDVTRSSAPKSAHPDPHSGAGENAPPARGAPAAAPPAIAPEAPLIFPTSMEPAVVAALGDVLAHCPSAQRQAVLDEVVAAQGKGKVHTGPVNFARGLVARANAGGFLPALGVEVRSRRESEARRIEREQVVATSAPPDMRPVGSYSDEELAKMPPNLRSKMTKLRDDARGALSPS